MKLMVLELDGKRVMFEYDRVKYSSFKDLCDNSLRPALTQLILEDEVEQPDFYMQITLLMAWMEGQKIDVEDPMFKEVMAMRQASRKAAKARTI